MSTSTSWSAVKAAGSSPRKICRFALRNRSTGCSRVSNGNGSRVPSSGSNLSATSRTRSDMERPEDLRAICQAGKGGDPGWYVIHRRISIYVTWVVLRAGIPLGAVSLAMMGLGIAGAGLISVQGGAWNALGFALLYFVFLLDKVDGEVARYRGIESVHGILLDRFYHRLVEPALFVAVALHQIGEGANPGLLAVGLG